MKYHILKHATPKFVPFDITFTIETEEEATLLHDVIACRIAESSTFIGDCFDAMTETRMDRRGGLPLAPQRG